MKAWWHMKAGKDTKHFWEMLVEIAWTTNPNLTIIDGIIDHEGNIPSSGELCSSGILGASVNVFALDKTMVNILGLTAVLSTVTAQTCFGLFSWNLALFTFLLLSPGR